MMLGPIEVTDKGVRIPSGTTFEQLQAAIVAVAMFRRCSPMWLGRLALIGQQRFGDRFWSALETNDASLEDIHRLVGVCSKVSAANWHPRLSMTHHQFAATLPPHMQASALQHAVDEALNSGEFRQFCSELRKGF